MKKRNPTHSDVAFAGYQQEFVFTTNDPSVNIPHQNRLIREYEFISKRTHQRNIKVMEEYIYPRVKSTIGPTQDDIYYVSLDTVIRIMALDLKYYKVGFFKEGFFEAKGIPEFITQFHRDIYISLFLLKVDTTLKAAVHYRGIPAGSPIFSLDDDQTPEKERIINLIP